MTKINRSMYHTFDIAQARIDELDQIVEVTKARESRRIDLIQRIHDLTAGAV